MKPILRLLTGIKPKKVLGELFYNFLIAFLIVELALPLHHLAAEPGDPAEDHASESLRHEVEGVPLSDEIEVLPIDAERDPYYAGIDDPESLRFLQEVRVEGVRPANLDFLGSQELRWDFDSRGDYQRSHPLHEPLVNRPVALPKDFKQNVRVIVRTNELALAIGKRAIDDPNFLAEVEHVFKGIRVMGDPIQDDNNLYLVNEDPKTRRPEAIRVLSIEQYVGNSGNRGAGNYHTIPLAHSVPLNHIPEGWKLLGYDFHARSKRPKQLLRIDTLQPVPSDWRLGGGDLVLDFETPDGEVVHVWAPLEIVHMGQFRRLEQLLWISLPDGAGVTQSEIKMVTDFLTEMEKEKELLRRMEHELAVFNRRHAENLNGMELGRRAIRGMNIPWMVNMLSPLETEAETIDNETIQMKRSRLEQLHMELRDRIAADPTPGEAWDRDFGRIQSERTARGDGGEASAVTSSWTADLFEAQRKEAEALLSFKKRTITRIRRKLGNFVSWAFTPTKMTFLGTIMAGTAVGRNLESEPVQQLTAVGSRMIELAQDTPLQHVIDPLNELGGFANGDWQALAMWGGGIGVAISFFYLAHVVAAGYARSRGHSEDGLFNRSFNQMLRLYCGILELVPAFTKRVLGQKQLYDWVFNTGEKKGIRRILANPFASREKKQQHAEELEKRYADKRNIDFIATDLAALLLASETHKISPDILFAVGGGELPEGATIDRESIEQSIKKLMEDPQQRVALFQTRGAIINAMQAMAAKDPSAIPADADFSKLRFEHYAKIAAAIKEMDAPKGMPTFLEQQWKSACALTSSNLLGFINYARDIALGINAAEFVESFKGKSMPDYVQRQAFQRGQIDFLLSEFMGGMLEKDLFTLPRNLEQLADKAPVYVGSMEQSVAWSMIAPANMFNTMMSHHSSSTSFPPVDSQRANPEAGGNSREMTLEQSLMGVLRGLTDPNPDRPGIFKNWLGYIKAAFTGHWARAAYIGTSAYVGFQLVYFLKPEDAGNLSQWSMWLLAPITAYLIIASKIGIHGFPKFGAAAGDGTLGLPVQGPESVGYAIVWPAADAVIKWPSEEAEINQVSITTALALLGSGDEMLCKKGAKLMKALFAKGSGWFLNTSIPSEFNIPSKEFTPELASQFALYASSKMPVATTDSNFHNNGVNFVATIFTTLIYFSLFKKLFGEPDTVYEAASSLGFYAKWFAITGVTMFGLTHLSNFVTKRVTAPIAQKIGAGKDWLKGCAQKIANTVKGKDTINLE